MREKVKEGWNQIWVFAKVGLALSVGVFIVLNIVRMNEISKKHADLVDTANTITEMQKRNTQLEGVNANLNNMNGQLKNHIVGSVKNVQKSRSHSEAKKIMQKLQGLQLQRVQAIPNYVVEAKRSALAECKVVTSDLPKEIKRADKAEKRIEELSKKIGALQEQLKKKKGGKTGRKTKR